MQTKRKDDARQEDLVGAFFFADYGQSPPPIRPIPGDYRGDSRTAVAKGPVRILKYV